VLSVCGVADGLPLPTLLSFVLVAFTIEFDNEFERQFVGADRPPTLVGPDPADSRPKAPRRDWIVSPTMAGLRARDVWLPLFGFIEKRWQGRSKLVRLTPKGRESQDAYRLRLAEVEQRWRERFGEDDVRALRQTLEKLVGEPTWETSPLTRGLVPHATGRRASVRTPEMLPHHPMVLHRGGWPDGS
jgi:hypothetical protein